MKYHQWLEYTVAEHKNDPCNTRHQCAFANYSLITKSTEEIEGLLLQNIKEECYEIAILEVHREHGSATFFH